MGECLTSRVVVSRTERKGYSCYGHDVRTYHQCMTCLQTDGNYSIKFPGLDALHKFTVHNPSLLFEPFQSAQ